VRADAEEPPDSRFCPEAHYLHAISPSSFSKTKNELPCKNWLKYLDLWDYNPYIPFAKLSVEHQTFF
jgi:hypothetical protein